MNKDMKWWYVLVLMVLLSCLPEPVRAGVYVDVGVGWINEVEIEVGEQTVSVPIDSAYLVFRGGYVHNRWHIEFEAVGNENRTFKTLKIYRRWEIF